MNMTQADKVMKALEHGPVTQRDAFVMGIYRLAAVVHDLREAGVNIYTERRLVDNADGTRSNIAVYWLA